MTAGKTLVELFGIPEIQFRSGVDIASESFLLLSSQEIAYEIENRYNEKIDPEMIEQTIICKDIEVLGSTGYGPKSRVIQVVNFGSNLFGLNTENNVREALRRYFTTYNYETLTEFDDGVRNVAIISRGRFSVTDLVRKRNGRDLLAVKFRERKKDVWLVELKGHSGAESWDFFTGLKQLLVLLDMRSKIIDLMASNRTKVKCAFAVPNHRVKAHKGNPCYSRELRKMVNILENPTSYKRYVGKKTYEYLTKAIEKYSLFELLTKDRPIVHFLMVAGVGSVTDVVTKNQLRDFLM